MSYPGFDGHLKKGTMVSGGVQMGRYSKEFKQEALELLKRGEKLASELA